MYVDILRAGVGGAGVCAWVVWVVVCVAVVG